MKSLTLPLFWQHYYSLDISIRKKAQKSDYLWRNNPFHPSLHFKCINREENIWSVRITLNYRAIGILDNDTISWFWIGSHDDYEKFFG